MKLREGKRGATWYLKYRLPDGQQIQQRLGRAWSGRGRPPAGHYTRRLAEEALQAVLTDARRGELDAPLATGATFADATAEWLRHAGQERACKASTLTDYRLVVRRLDEALGEVPIEDVSTETIERWRDAWVAREQPSNRTVQKYLVVLGSIFRHAKRRYRLPANPLDDVERPRVRPKMEIDILSAPEVWALVRAAASEQDAAIFLTAAFTGLRQGELLALRWRDVDFEGRVVRVNRTYKSGNGVGTPKSGKGRSVPMADEVARSLARLGERENYTEDDDLVFRGPTDHVNAQRLGSRYKAALKRAGLRELRFHDLRHTFGTIAINRADIIQVQAWMGHADIKTTQRYLHYKSRGDEAELLSGAFAAGAPEQLEAAA
ncbi:MAG: site-specific integrase [Chloroflexi bacterium]|nr:site-specific integrase [Chloroflexota bacterium]